MRAHLDEQALHTPTDDHGAFGLTAVEERVEGERRDDGHGSIMAPDVHGLNPGNEGDCIFDKPGARTMKSAWIKTRFNVTHSPHKIMGADYAPLWEA
jgi:hypothetical protein